MAGTKANFTAQLDGACKACRANGPISTEGQAATTSDAGEEEVVVASLIKRIRLAVGLAAEHGEPLSGSLVRFDRRGQLHPKAGPDGIRIRSAFLTVVNRAVAGVIVRVTESSEPDSDDRDSDTSSSDEDDGGSLAATGVSLRYRSTWTSGVRGS